MRYAKRLASGLEGAVGCQLSRVAFNVMVFPLLYNSFSALWIKTTNIQEQTTMYYNSLSIFTFFILIDGCSALNINLYIGHECAVIKLRLNVTMNHF